jgi:hypothetical protein
LKARTNLEALCTDGGNNGPGLEALLRQYCIKHIPTHVRGGRSGPERPGREAFSWKRDGAGVPLVVSCPGGQQAEVRAGRRAGRFLADFDQTRCGGCLLANQSPTQPLNRRPVRVLRVRARQVHVTQLRQRAAQAR